MTSDETSKNTKDIIEATTALVEAVPIYEDAVQPAAKVTGKSLETIAETVFVALMPLRAIVWGANQFEGFIKDKVTSKLKNTDPEDIETPDPKIAGPAFESLRYTSDDDKQIQDAYANLFANAMNRKNKGIVHPAFVEILKQFNARDLLISDAILQNSATPAIAINLKISDHEGKRRIHRIVTLLGNQFTEISILDIQVSIENLDRLGLLELKFDSILTAVDTYKTFDDLPIVSQTKTALTNSTEGTYQQTNFAIHRTELGRRFYKVCLAPYG